MNKRGSILTTDATIAAILALIAVAAVYHILELREDTQWTELRMTEIGYGIAQTIITDEDLEPVGGNGTLRILTPGYLNGKLDDMVPENYLMNMKVEVFFKYKPELHGDKFFGNYVEAGDIIENKNVVSGRVLKVKKEKVSGNDYFAIVTFNIAER